MARGKRRIVIDATVRWGRFFGVSPQLWVNLQSRHCLEIEKEMLGDNVGVTHLPGLTSRVLLETERP